MWHPANHWLAAAMSAGIGTLAGGAIAATVGLPVGIGIASALAGVATTYLVGHLFSLSHERWLARGSLAVPSPIEQFSCELAVPATREQLIAAMQRCIRRSIPCDEIRVVPTETSNSDACASNDTQTDHLLRIHLRLNTRSFAVLEVWRCDEQPAFNPEERSALRAVVNHTTIGLALTERWEELDHLDLKQTRSREAAQAAWLDTVAAEIAHEIRYPINFFREIFGRGSAGAPLDAEEIDIGREEVNRLERMVSGLRRMPKAKLERHSVPLSELASRAEMLLRPRFANRALQLDLPATVCLLCDRDHATQVIVNLLSNALDATVDGGHVGVSWNVEGAQAKLVVWDTGPGFTEDAAKKLFVPWYTTKPDGTGLGLAIAHRLVQAHGWTIDAIRRDAKTCFEVSISPGDVRSEPELTRREIPGEDPHC